MTKHDEGRRAFLVGTAVGAGAAASVALVPEAFAKDHPQHHTAADAPAMAPGDHGNGDTAGMSMGDRHGAFFNDDDSRTIVAFTERLMPGAPGKPGATDADVLNYIDLALAGAYADQQDFYRRGLTQLDAYCSQAYGKPFRHLTAAQQDETITALEAGKAAAFVFPTAAAFFNTVRTHTMEGMFADPVYGGNKNFAGWRLVQFPGAQPVFTEADMRSTQAFSREPIVGLQSRAANLKTGKEG
ncbi:MAG TPA: gluconate 2-dehydrogenase subunit 3 family protein [Xanthobacteraceae bacterium]|jgi:gluconate 2-dehydrogenase gamma chain|nr:gluconate 2-dehydrogenase subunit 3 family protein [Xanthobacteraceae bacterium]